MKSIAIVGNIASLSYLIGKELRNCGFYVDNYFSYNSLTTMSDSKFQINIGKVHKIPFERTLRKAWLRTVKECDLEIRLSTERYVKSKHSIIIYNGSDLRDGLIGLESRCFITTKDLYRYVGNSDAVFLPRCIDTELFTPRNRKKWREGEPLIVGHFPTNAKIKGTDLVNEALTVLRSMGYNCDLLSERVSHNKMPDYLSQIHVLCDQFTTGIYGIVTIEALAVGTPVVCYVNDEYFDYPHMRDFIVNCEPNPRSIAKGILRATNVSVDSWKIQELYSPRRTVDVLLKTLYDWKILEQN